MKTIKKSFDAMLLIEVQSGCHGISADLRDIAHKIFVESGFE